MAILSLIMFIFIVIFQSTYKKCVIGFFSVKFYLALEKVEYSKKSKSIDNDSKPLLINKDVKTWSMYTKFGTIVLLVCSDFYLT
jgi:hypothetical protein